MNFLNVYGPGLAILFVVFVEAAGVFWFYGVENFSNDIKQMLGHRPGLFWRICWGYISPVFLLVSSLFFVNQIFFLNNKILFSVFSYFRYWVTRIC